MIVKVKEPRRREWRGTAESLKFSKESGWWFDVRNDDGLTWACHEKHVRRVK
jgi:hypothetical protein